MLLVVVFLGAAASAVLGILRVHQRAAAAADLAALAGAGAVPTGSDPCNRAAVLAAANRTRLLSCRQEGDDVLVSVIAEIPGAGRLVGGLGSRVGAAARAGPATVMAPAAEP